MGRLTHKSSFIKKIEDFSWLKVLGSDTWLGQLSLSFDDGHKFEIQSNLFITLIYSKIFNIRHTKLPNLNVSRLVMRLSLPNPMKPVVKSRMKM